MRPGSSLGHYEILSAIGKGGMGEVWKARDTRLRRDVAIKMLPAALGADQKRLGDLIREAELLATLNHPNIATIHGLEERDGVRFLVLELVEGGTLANRMSRGPVPIKPALALAVQITMALEAAHGKGVVHRDLKPANIALTPDGRVKVLDFGIAKAFTAESGDEQPTIEQTAAGIIKGTPSYMSPEQVRGEAAGVQTDIWAFGVVFYELLTGRSPFAQSTAAETMARVLEGRPDYAALPSTTPPIARRMLERCLASDRRQRMQHIGDVRLGIEDILAGLDTEAPATISPATGRSRSLAWVAAALVVAAVAAAGGWLAAGRSTADEAASVRASLSFVEPPMNLPIGASHIAISDDGSTVAYVSGTRLWIRRLDGKEAISVSGGGSNPFFSPDGAWVAYFVAGAALVKVPVRGGTPVTIAENTDRNAGGAWRADGTIVFATPDGLFQVSANGGDVRPLAKPDRDRKETLYAFPEFLPGGQSVLFTVAMEGGAGGPRLARLDLASLAQTPVLPDASAAQYVSSGHLVYVSGATLHVAAFDAAKGAIVGTPLAITDVDVATAADNGAARFAVAGNGTLIVVRPFQQVPRTLQWIDREGRVEPIAVEPQTYSYPTVSPDGTRVAVERTTRANRDIWILDLKRLTQTQLTDGPTEDLLPVWSADGTRVFFSSRRAGNIDVYSQAVDGGSPAKLEFAGPDFQAPMSVSPDGTRLLVSDRYVDVGLLDLAHPDHLVPLLNTKFDEFLPQISPDGRWVAYESDESGDRLEIFLRPFPNVTDRREKISVNGGRYPRWGPKGRNELYFLAIDGGMMAASVTLSPTLVLGPVKKLFDYDPLSSARSGPIYSVSPIDGRFLFAKRTAPLDAPTDVTMILNWLPHVRQQLQR